jgi:hypothetical protein
MPNVKEVITVATKSGPKSKKKKKTLKKRGSAGDVVIPKVLFESLERVYRFKKRQQTALVAQVANVDTLGSFQFTLSTVNGQSQLCQSFDSYKIEFVECIFRPVYNMMAVSSNATVITPLLYTAIDLDDNSNPASLGALLEYGTCSESNFDKSVTRSFRPRVAKALYDGSVFTSYGMDTPWIDCNSNTVKHFGIKYGIQAGASGQTNLQAWRVDFVYYLAFRYPR